MHSRFPGNQKEERKTREIVSLRYLFAWGEKKNDGEKKGMGERLAASWQREHREHLLRAPLQLLIPVLLMFMVRLWRPHRLDDIRIRHWTALPIRRPAARRAWTAGDRYSRLFRLERRLAKRRSRALRRRYRRNRCAGRAITHHRERLARRRRLRRTR